MAAVIIKQKDLKRLGKEVVKELYDFFNDEYIFNTFPEMKEERKTFLNNLTYSYLSHFNFTLIQKETSWKNEYEPIDENKFNEELENIKEKIKDGSLPIDVIHSAVEQLNFKGNNEINEDLYAKAYAFKNMFSVYDSDYTFL